MGYYCHIDSSGDIEHTNLQLYSLEQAAKYWNMLVEEMKNCGDNDVPKFKEKIVFILNCFGLSLSQLLGQNWPCLSKDRVDQPNELLSNILKKSSLDQNQRKWLNKTFKDFLIYYGAIRHFGRNKGDTIYRSIDDLDLRKLEGFRKLTIEIRNFYEKVTDTFATSIDYDPKTDYAKKFYATVQNKFHYAIHGHTAAELITKRIDSNKLNMGLTNWKGEIITEQDAKDS